MVTSQNNLFDYNQLGLLPQKICCGTKEASGEILPSSNGSLFLVKPQNVAASTRILLTRLIAAIHLVIGTRKLAPRNCLFSKLMKYPGALGAHPQSKQCGMISDQMPIKSSRAEAEVHRKSNYNDFSNNFRFIVFLWRRKLLFFFFFCSPPSPFINLFALPIRRRFNGAPKVTQLHTIQPSIDPLLCP